MDILLQGRDTQLTSTVEDMLSSVKGWNIKRISSITFRNKESAFNSSNKKKINIIACNLAGYSAPPKQIIKNTNSHFTPIPLLVLHTFNRKLFIEPLLKAGALSYVQLGISEDRIQKAVEITSKGKRYIDVKKTY